MVDSVEVPGATKVAAMEDGRVAVAWGGKVVEVVREGDQLGTAVGFVRGGCRRGALEQDSFAAWS